MPMTCVKRSTAEDPIKTVFGGVHASWGKDSLLQKYGEIDFIIAGKANTLFVNLPRRAMFFDRSLYFRNGGSIESGPPIRRSVTWIRCLSAYDLLNGFPRRYLLPLFGIPRIPARASCRRGLRLPVLVLRPVGVRKKFQMEFAGIYG